MHSTCVWTRTRYGGGDIALRRASDHYGFAEYKLCCVMLCVCVELLRDDDKEAKRWGYACECACVILVFFSCHCGGGVYLLVANGDSECVRGCVWFVVVSCKSCFDKLFRLCSTSISIYRQTFWPQSQTRNMV